LAQGLEIIMTIIDHTHTGDVDFSDETVLVSGTIKGNVTVCKGTLLDLRGTIEGDLVVHMGAAAWVRGRVSGNAVNTGGTLNISGTVSGDVVFEMGLVAYFEGASVNGRLMPPSQLN
jgi:cytoskeletal protein CcmA (bactofilin family)